MQEDNLRHHSRSALRIGLMVEGGLGMAAVAEAEAAFQRREENAA